MKRGKKPTLRQKKAIASSNLNPNNWLVSRVTTGRLHLVHRYTGSQRAVYYDTAAQR